MKTLILLLVLVCAAWFFWNHEDSPIEAEAPAIAETPAPPNVKISEPPTVDPGQLVAIRGEVVSVDGDFMIVDCEDEPDIPGFAWNVDAGSGGAEIAQLASLAVSTKNERTTKKFGSMQMAKNGVLMPSKLEANSRPLGRFALHGFPARTVYVHVIAARTGKSINGLDIYTVNFKLPEELVTATPSINYPPGVDTPEKRRAYWQAVVEERKKKSVQNR